MDPTSIDAENSSAHLSSPPIAEPVRWSMRVAKADVEKRLVYGIAMEPDTVDADGDHWRRETIEEAAHRFMVESKAGSGVDDNHERFRVSASVVESFIAPVDFVFNREVVLAGSWVVAIKVYDEDLWQAVKRGERDGLSIVGYATRGGENA